MENYKIGIQNDFGGYDSFYIDGQILEGLYITGDIDKIKDNCSTFNIEANQDYNTKISKRDNVVILTTYVGENEILQFLIGHDLNLKKLKLVSQKILPNDIKNIIKEAFKYTNPLQLSDLLK